MSSCQVRDYYEKIYAMPPRRFHLAQLVFELTATGFAV